MNVILLEPAEAADVVTLSDARGAHVRSVLRATPGQPVRIGIVDGPLGTGTVMASEEHQVTLACKFDAHVPPRPRVDLLLALPRPKVMRRLWAQVAALGVGRILLTNAERVERNYFDTHVLAPECYRPLLLEGLQQARDTRVPLVSIHRQFRKLVEAELDALSDAGTRLMADPDTGRLPSTSLRPGKPAPTTDGRVLLAVGPEGGWNDFERELLARRGFQPMAFGTRTLRSDTACIALLTLVHARLDA